MSYILFYFEEKVQGWCNGMKWIGFPPVLSLILLIPVVFLHNREAAYYIPAVVWGTVIASYICLCGVSVFYLVRNEQKYGFGITAVAQGLMLSIVSLQLGVTFLSWLGLVLFLIGLMSLFYYATRGDVQSDVVKKETDEDKETEREHIDNVLAKLNLPVCIVDNKGIIAKASPRFCEVLDKSESDVDGEIISDVLPIDDGNVMLASGKWWISQVKEGSRYYFYLLPTEDGNPVPQSILMQQASGSLANLPLELGIYDPSTGLYNEAYRQKRGIEEVDRAQRYKRNLSGILLELVFEAGPDINLSDDQKTMLENAFAAKVAASLRTMDSGFLMADKRIQLLLPETPQAGAKTMLTRLLMLPQDVFDEDIREAVSPKVRSGLTFYNGTTRMDYALFSATLEQELIKSRESAAVH